MASRIIAFLFLVLYFINDSYCQLNRIRPALVQCYNDSAIPGITSPNNRPPSTLNIFVELIRRLEDTNPNLSARDLSVLILQRLRQDGIMNNGQTMSSSYGIPFGLTRNERFKTTEILNSFLPNSTSTLRYGDLTSRDICTLHYIISSTINDRARGDESNTCQRSARYTERLRRDTGNVDPHRKVNTDIESVDSFGTRALGVGNYEFSQCPLEMGVFLTNYGTIKGGQVLAGIAAGFNPQTTYDADNRYAATITGELAEAALSQGQDNIRIGVSGGWNSTLSPRYYFLGSKDGLEVTDAEIRGSLDGLYMALKMDNWRSYDIKISQIIDMYYTRYQKGVLDSRIKACSRNILYTEMTNERIVKDEMLAFINRLDDTSSYGLTFNQEEYSPLTDVAYNSFVSYLPQMNKQDLSCVPVEKIDRVATDLLIFVDAGWEYNTINLLLSNILDSIDVNRFGTRYTIFNGANGLNMTSNRTNNLLDFYNNYNLTAHQKYTFGFDYARVYQVLESAYKSKLENSTYYGRESTVVLLIPRSSPSQDQKDFLETKRDTIRRFLPDLNIIVLGVGAQSDYNSIINNQDFILFSDANRENDIKNIGQNVVARIKNANRAIVNPSCGASFSGSANSFEFSDYVEPFGVNYYRIHPNYFYSGGGGRTLKITENGFGVIQYCISRSQTKPSNISDTCKTLRSTVESTDISSYCSGSLTDCAPIYMSIEGMSSSIRCKEYGCRYPDNIKYTIRMENVGCASGSVRIAFNMIALATVLILTLL